MTSRGNKSKMEMYEQFNCSGYFALAC